MDRFIFAPYKPGSKISCPKCGTRGSFSRYIDAETGKYLPGHVGICDRIEKCGHKYSWFEYIRDEGIDVDFTTDNPVIEEKPKNVFSTIPKEIFDKSFRKQGEDTLSVFLVQTFGAERVLPVLKKYKIGYANAWDKHCTVFWLVDRKGRIRSGKIMAYEERDGDIKRVKGKDKSFIDWVHRSIKDRDSFYLKQCFFGEHLLLAEPNKRVNIVEGEKTTLICSLFDKENIWLSTGSLNGINDDKMLPLKDREIVLFPDVGEKAFEIWNKKVELYSEQGYNISIRKTIAPGLSDGDDLADWIIYNLRKFE